MTNRLRAGHAFTLALLAAAGCTPQRSFKRTELPPAQSQALAELRFLDDEHLFARNNGEFRLWNVRTGAVEKRFFAPQMSAGATRGSFNISGDGALAGYDDGKSIRVLRTDAGGERASFVARARGAVLAVASDGVVITLDPEAGINPKSSTLRAWKPGTPEPAWERTLGTAYAFRAFDSAVTFVAVADQKKLTMIEIASGRDVWNRPIDANGDITFSSDGTRIAVREGSYFVVRDASSGTEVGRVAPMSGYLMAFPGDLFFREASGWVHRFDPSGTKRWTIPLRDASGSNRNLLSSVVSPHGTKMVLNIEAVNTLDLYDAATGARERMIARENDYKQRVIINLIAVSPDDSLVAVAEDSSLVVWKADGSKHFTALVDPALKKP